MGNAVAINTLIHEEVKKCSVNVVETGKSLDVYVQLSMIGDNLGTMISVKPLYAAITV